MPKSNNRQYRTVSEMLRQSAGQDEALTADELDKFSAERELVKDLATLRSARGLSQQDLALSLGRTQSWVSKLENGRDDDLRLGEIRTYLDALGLEFRPGAIKKGATCTDEIKHFVGAIKRRFLTLVELAKKDDAMAENIALFFCETFYNINKHLSEAAAKLPAGREGKPHITVTYKFGLLDELEEDCDEDDPDPTARFAFPSRNEAALN